MRGRKPTPNRVRLLGTVPLAARYTGDGPPPEAPEWLSDVAREEWERIVPELAKQFLLTPVDISTLATYCESFAAYKDAVLTVRREGSTLPDPKTGVSKLHPLARYSMSLLAELRKLAGEFGFSPAARGRMDSPPPPNKEEDDFETFTNEGPSGPVQGLEARQAGTPGGTVA